MKIAFVDNTLWGLLNFRGNVIKSLKEENQIILITPGNKKINTEGYANKNIELKIDRKGKNPLKDLIYFLNLFKIYMKEKPELVFHYTIKPNIYGSLVARILKIRCISIIPGLGSLFDKNDLGTKIAKILYKEALKGCEKVLFLNKEDASVFLKQGLVDYKKIQLIPGEGVDIQKFSIQKKEKKKNKIVFLMVTRVLWTKGFKEYISAAEILKRKYSNLEFQLLGIIDTENPEGVSKEVILEQHEKKTIIYLGETDNVCKFIKGCDCIVHPTFYREGLPRVLLEGAAMGKPLITTDNVGCRDVVEENYNGFLCEIKNVDSLVNSIEKFLELSEEEREKLGRNGRLKIEQEFSDEIIIKKYKELGIK